uniref:Large ribosomal subunit protein P1 n=1 Tax=Arenicola marina TaxID=6344 RepID=A8UFP8_AREMA|nr:ribosomal protein rplp1 [Arenicola marina]
MASRDELACIYSALILVDDDVPVTAEKINTICQAAGLNIEPYWPSLFARALTGVDIKALISNIGSASAAPAAAGAAPAAAEEKKEEKKEAKEESADESDEDMGFGLFD